MGLLINGEACQGHAVCKETFSMARGKADLLAMADVG
jgi:hypothetical protein